jgi:hypothetical protein
MDGPDLIKRERGSRRPSTVDRRRRHGWNHRNLTGGHCFGDSDHHSTNGKYREGEQDMASSPRTRRKSNDGSRAVLSSGWRRQIPMNMVMRDELVRKKERRLGSFRNMTRSLEAGLRDRRRNEFNESISMAAGRARAHGDNAHKSHSGF